MDSAEKTGAYVGSQLLGESLHPQDCSRYVGVRACLDFVGVSLDCCKVRKVNVSVGTYDCDLLNGKPSILNRKLQTLTALTSQGYGEAKPSLIRSQLHRDQCKLVGA